MMSGPGLVDLSSVASVDEGIQKILIQAPVPEYNTLDLIVMSADDLAQRKGGNKIEADHRHLSHKEAVAPGPGHRPLRKTPRNYADPERDFGTPRLKVLKAIAPFVGAPSAR